MAYALVRSTISPTLASSVAPVYGGTPTAGNLLLASASNQTNTTPLSCSDTNGAWTLLTSSTGQSRWLGLFGLIAVASQPTTVTVSGATNVCANIYEFSGIVLTNGLNIANVVAYNHGSPSTANGATGTATTAASLSGAYGTGDLIFHQAMVTGGAVTSPTFTNNNGGAFTAGQAGPALIRLIDYYKLSSAVGTTYDGTIGWTTARNWVTQKTEFRIAAQGFM